MRVGVVHGSPSMATSLMRVVALRASDSVLWSTASGIEAVSLCAKQKPDVVLLDLMASGIDGVEVTRRIMAGSPCAILIVTSSLHANVSRVFEAMGHGALDVLDVPPLTSGDLQKDAQPLLTKLATISRLIGDTKKEVAAPVEIANSLPLVAIGASTGGPPVLATILRGLTPAVRATIVVVQHVDERFTAGLTGWLSDQSGLPVTVATEGQRLTRGHVFVAGTSDHLVFKSAERLGYTTDPVECVYRPSVDVFLRSAVRWWRGDLVGILLTGMGSDGAIGLKEMRIRGHHTIAQDEATSAVYGMPKAAALLNAAVDVLPIERIAGRVVEVLARTARGPQSFIA
jgi:two-component system, chemotaxis family, response regulator WspF